MKSPRSHYSSIPSKYSIAPHTEDNKISIFKYKKRFGCQVIHCFSNFYYVALDDNDDKESVPSEYLSV